MFPTNKLELSALILAHAGDSNCQNTMHSHEYACTTDNPLYRLQENSGMWISVKVIKHKKCFQQLNWNYVP